MVAHRPHRAKRSRTTWLLKTLADAQVDAARGLCQTHGTDAARHQSSSTLFERFWNTRPAGTPCAGGGNLGHLEAAASVAGLIKTALALHHRKVPRNLNFRH
jgi:acyl transferase domain-containing protein